MRRSHAFVVVLSLVLLVVLGMVLWTGGRAAPEAARTDASAVEQSPPEGISAELGERSDEPIDRRAVAEAAAGTTKVSISGRLVDGGVPLPGRTVEFVTRRRFAGDFEFVMPGRKAAQSAVSDADAHSDQGDDAL